MLPADFDDIVAKLRALGVTRYKADGLEIELGPPPLPPARPREATDTERPTRTSDDILFAASRMKPRRSSDGSQG